MIEIQFQMLNSFIKIIDFMFLISSAKKKEHTYFFEQNVQYLRKMTKVQLGIEKNLVHYFTKPSKDLKMYR